MAARRWWLHLLVALGLALGLLLTGLPTAGAVPGGARADPASGPHAKEEVRHQGAPAALHPATTRVEPRLVRPRAAAPLAGAVPVAAVSPAREVFGFAPYWELPASGAWRYDLLTTVAYFGLDVRGDGSFDTGTGGWTGWNSQELVDTVDRTHRAGGRAVVVIKQFDEATINRIVTSPAAAQATIANTIAAIASRQLDGVNVDFEGSSSPSYPGLQGGVTSFMSHLSSQVHGRWPGAMVSMDTYTGSAGWDGGIFRIGDLAPAVDAFFVMAYDMAASNMPGEAGPNAPLTGGFTYTDSTAVAQYLARAPASKVILGVPYYGYKYSTGGSSARYAAASDAGAADTYADAQEDLACALQLSRAWDEASQTPWATWWSPAGGDPCGGDHDSWRELYYDTPQSLALKYDLVNASGLRGAGIWALGYDGMAPDLWNVIADRLTDRLPPFAGFAPLGGNVVLVQSRLGTRASFELVAPLATGGLVHYSRADDLPGQPWAGGDTFGGGLGHVDAVTMIQSDFGTAGNLEIVARAGDTLHAFWRDSATLAWHGPSAITRGASGVPALIQGRFGTRGNFELVTPLAAGGLAHLWRDNDDPGYPWRQGAQLGQGLGTVGAVTLIESNFGSPGNLEVVARAGSDLWSLFRDTAWRGPGELPPGLVGAAGGVPSLIQGRFGRRGNFELVTPLAGGGLVHVWRDDDDPALSWKAGGHPGQGLGTVDSASLIQGSLSSPGDLELAVQGGPNLWLLHRDSNPPFAWHGP